MENTKQIVKLLACKLTDAELLETARGLSGELAKRAQLDAQLASFKKQIGADIEKCDASIEKFREMISSGEEYRDVECELTYRWAEGVKTTTRKDSGEIVREQVISEDERQMKLVDDKRSNAPLVQ
jgi:hypothetical protein